MKLYDLVRKLLSDNPTFRNSDKPLIWQIWRKQGLVGDGMGEGVITYNNFVEKAQSSESITRARRKVQEDHPELGSNELVKSMRTKNLAKGKYKAYHDNVEVVFNSEDNTFKKVVRG